MPSPFPGIDPYIEAQGRWRDFHSRFSIYCCDSLSGHLSGPYVAQMEEQVHLVRMPGEPAKSLLPDIAVLRNPSPPMRFLGRGKGVATLEPQTIRLETGGFEEVRQTRIEIRRLPGMSLVTIVELLSPTNKIGFGQQVYLDKRVNLIRQPVHIVELDFLLGGHRLPMQDPLPAGDAYAMVSRMERRPDADVYAWGLRQALPTIPIPLSSPDPDVHLDLAPAFATAYERGNYARILRYSEPLVLPLDPETLHWVETRARDALPR